MNADRLFVSQIVIVREEQWHEWHENDNTTTVLRVQKHYHVNQHLFSATDEESAYRMVSGWIQDGGFSDANHDGPGDLTRYYAIGIHDLEEIESLDNFTGKVREIYGVCLPVISFDACDGDRIPRIKTKEQLEVFRLLNLHKRRRDGE